MRIFKNFNNKSVLIISFIFFGIFLTPFFMQAVSSFRNGYFETGIFIIAMILLIILSSLYSFYTMPYAGLDQSSLTIFRGKRQKSIRFNEIKEIRITRRKKKGYKIKIYTKNPDEMFGYILYNRELFKELTALAEEYQWEINNPYKIDFYF